MNFNHLEEFIKLAKDSGVKELKYETDGVKLSVSMPFSEAPTASMVASQLATASPVVASEGASAGAKTSQETGLVEIASPFVGTFYRASSPNSEPYAKKGQRVSKGDVLCIVEAMKIMNEIESDVDGEVVEVCAENENYVEFGQVLLKIRPS